MNKNYFILACTFFFGWATVCAQIPLTPAHSVDKTVNTPTNNNPVADVTPPTVTCLNVVSVNIMPTGMIQLWATDFLQHAEDNITPLDQIQFGIRKSGSGTGFPLNPGGQATANILFDCDELGPQHIELWAKDLAGNSSSCEASVNIQDNFGNFCNGGNGTPGLITVHLMAGQNGVEGAEFQITGTDSLGVPFQYFIQDNNGNIVVPVGSSGTITPVKDDNPLNGVTTYDNVIISKHVRGTAPFTTPYQWVAADANRDNVVDQQDSLEFRDLILGIYQELPSNTSWRFVLADYNFPTPNPLSQPFPESFSFANIQEHITVEFKAIKVGDVNGSAVANAFAPPPPPLDTEPPVVNCLNGLSVNIMPTGQISLWTTDFLLNVSDNETPYDQIKLGVRKAGTGTGFPLDFAGNPISNLLYSCSELGTHTVELWAVDLAGNADYCTSTLIVQDNQANCGGSSGINGKVCVKQFCTENGVEEPYFEVRSDSSSFAPPFSLFFMGNEQGCGEFNNAVPLGPNLRIYPLKDDNPLNGVTSYDLQLLSKHIHGILPFTEPWQYIAADANRDNVIDIQDSIEFVKLIVGVYQELPNNTSWRFVRSNYVFPSPNPLSQPFPEYIKVNGLVDSVQILFYGIKIGDLSVPCTQLSPVVEPDHNFATKMIPNPTHAGATVTFELPGADNVRLQVNDLSGKLVYDEALKMPSGNQSVEIPAAAMNHAGMYFWRMEIGGKMMSGKLIRL
jgi:hypothetical protein